MTTSERILQQDTETQNPADVQVNTLYNNLCHQYVNVSSLIKCFKRSINWKTPFTIGKTQELQKKNSKNLKWIAKKVCGVQLWILPAPMY